MSTTDEQRLRQALRICGIRPADIAAIFEMYDGLAAPSHPEPETREVDEAHMARMCERGAVAWAGYSTAESPAPSHPEGAAAMEESMDAIKDAMYVASHPKGAVPEAVPEFVTVKGLVRPYCVVCGFVPETECSACGRAAPPATLEGARDALRYRLLASLAHWEDERDFAPGGRWWLAVLVKDGRPSFDAAIDAALQGQQGAEQ